MKPVTRDVKPWPVFVQIAGVSIRLSEVKSYEDGCAIFENGMKFKISVTEGKALQAALADRPVNTIKPQSRIKESNAKSKTESPEKRVHDVLVTRDGSRESSPDAAHPATVL